tara:strand:+ start:51 stop:1220 length:1170 start_codon:yes stop_codon:yes gene_type:complete
MENAVRQVASTLPLEAARKTAETAWLISQKIQKHNASPDWRKPLDSHGIITSAISELKRVTANPQLFFLIFLCLVGAYYASVLFGDTDGVVQSELNEAFSKSSDAVTAYADEFIGRFWPREGKIVEGAVTAILAEAVSLSAATTGRAVLARSKRKLHHLLTFGKLGNLSNAERALKDAYDRSKPGPTKDAYAILLNKSPKYKEWKETEQIERTAINCIETLLFFALLSSIGLHVWQKYIPGDIVATLHPFYVAPSMIKFMDSVRFMTVGNMATAPAYLGWSALSALRHGTEQTVAAATDWTGSTAIQHLFGKANQNYIGNAERARQAFRDIDTDNSGSISQYEFFLSMCEVDETVTLENASRVFKELDTDNSGSISEDEYVKYYVEGNP